METINDIQFNANFFNQFNHLVTLLYQTNGTNPAIKISNKNLLTFLKRFNDIIRCQNLIKDNERKTFTLFTFSDNIYTWLRNHNPIQDNLQEIFIFCLNHEEIAFYTDWTKQYTQKITDIITTDQLERHLLTFGMKYLLNLSSNLQEDDPIQSKLEEHIESMRLALSNLLSQTTNNN